MYEAVGVQSSEGDPEVSSFFFDRVQKRFGKPQPVDTCRRRPRVRNHAAPVYVKALLVTRRGRLRRAQRLPCR